MLKYLRVVLLLVCSVASVLSQNITKKNYKSPSSYVLADVQVVGLKQFSPATIISYTGFKIGQEIEIPGDKISKTIDKLWKQDLFSQVDIYSYKVSGDSIYLMLELLELPYISRIRFQGVDDEEEVLKKIKIKVGDRLTRNLLVEVKDVVRNFYIEEGHYFAQVTLDTQKSLDEKNAVELSISVDPGEEMEVHEIIFEGVKQVDVDDLKGEMEKTKEDKWWRWFSDSKVVQRDLKEDEKKVLDYYLAKGFRDATVEVDSLYLFDEDHLNILIRVREGRRYRYKDIRWSGNELYPSSLLSRVLQIQKGDVYDAKRLNERILADKDGSDIRSLYMDRGYLFANITPIERQVSGDSISLEIQVQEGKPATVDKVSFSGNTVTKDDIVLRTIRTKPGDLFSKTAIQRTFRELAQLSFFDPEKIGVDPLPNPATNTVDIHYTLSEKSTSQVQLQGGWGGGGLFGSVGLSFGNFAGSGLFDADEWRPIPRGDGQKLSVQFQKGTYYSTSSLSFTEPYLTRGYKPFSLSTSLYYTNRTYAVQTSYSRFNTDDSRNLSILGMDVGVNKGLTVPDDFFYIGLQVSYQRYTLKDYPISLFDFSTGNSNNLSYSISLNRNSSGPNPIYPTTGSLFTVKFKFTFPYSLFEKDLTSLTSAQKLDWLEFYKVTFKADWYASIWDQLVLRLNTQLGYLGAYDYRMGVSPFERFFVGGTGLAQNFRDAREIIPLRGYPENSLSDTYGSTAFSKFSMELRYPVTLKPTASIYVLSFLEMGNGRRVASNLDFSTFDLKRSTGFGIRIFMPFFGMLGFDMGYGFDPVFSGKNSGWNTHFILGQQF